MELGPVVLKLEAWIKIDVTATLRRRSDDRGLGIDKLKTSQRVDKYNHIILHHLSIRFTLTVTFSGSIVIASVTEVSPLRDILPLVHCRRLPRLGASVVDTSRL